MSGQLSVRLGLRFTSGEAGCMFGGDSIINSLDTTYNAPATALLACWPACFVSQIESNTGRAPQDQFKDPCQTKEARELGPKPSGHTVRDHDHEIYCDFAIKHARHVQRGTGHEP